MRKGGRTIASIVFLAAAVPLFAGLRVSAVASPAQQDENEQLRAEIQRLKTENARLTAQLETLRPPVRNDVPTAATDSKTVTPAASATPVNLREVLIRMDGYAAAYAAQPTTLLKQDDFRFPV